MKTIAVFNQKGGVAKTTTVATLAHIFSNIYDKKVLVVDLDSQGNASSLFSPDPPDLEEIIISIIRGTEVKSPYDKTIADLLLDSDLDPRDVILHSPYDKLDFIPSFIDLAACEDKIKSDVTMIQQFKLRHQLNKVSNDYDYCFLDCSPSLSITNINGLAAADYYLIPLSPEYFSLKAMREVKETCKVVLDYNPKLQCLGCFLSLVNITHEVDSVYHDVLSQTLEDFIDIPIRQATVAKQMTTSHAPLVNIKRYRNGKKQLNAIADDYLKLAAYIMKEI